MKACVCAPGTLLSVRYMKPTLTTDMVGVYTVGVGRHFVTPDIDDRRPTLMTRVWRDPTLSAVKIVGSCVADFTLLCHII